VADLPQRRVDDRELRPEQARPAQAGGDARAARAARHQVARKRLRLQARVEGRID